MSEEEFDYKKPSFVLFIIIVAIVIVVLLMDWVFTFFKERM
jgi:hypothetical protein